MSGSMRRVIIENDENAQSVIADDAQLPTVAPQSGTGIVGAELWSSDVMPVDNSKAAGAEQKLGVIQKHGSLLLVGNGQGTAFRITEFPAGHAKISHRTTTLDYDIILAGEIDLEVDGGQAVTLKTGEVVIVRGAKHAWINRKTETAMVAFVMIDANPVVVDGDELGTIIPGQ